MISLVLSLLLELFLFSFEVVDLALIRENFLAEIKGSVVALGVTATTVFHVEDGEHAIYTNREEMRVSMGNS